MKSKIIDFKRTKYGSIIYISWAILISCFIIKIFGLNVFEFESGNEKFDKFCDFVDKTQWLKMAIACVLYVLSTKLILHIILNKNKFSTKIKVLFLPLMFLKSLISWYNTILAFILDLLITLVIPIIMTRKIKRPLICILFVLLFQVITIVFRNLSFDFNKNNSFVEQILYQVDYYIMILLFYLHNFNEKEKS